MTRSGKIGWGGVLVAIAVTLGYGFWPKPVPVEVASAAIKPMRVVIEEEGRTRVIDRYVISAPVAGYGRRLEWHVGDVVSQNQVLLELEPLRSGVLDPRSRAEANARVSAANAALLAAQETMRAAKANATLAKDEAERLVRLCAVQCVSKQEEERAQTEAQRAEAVLRSAQFGVEVARYDLAAAKTALQHSAAQEAGKPSETVAVKSPINGQVLKVYKESEGVVATGEALLEVGDPRALEVVVEMLSADAVRVKPGMRVLFDRWGGGEPLQGSVRRVEPVGFTKISALGVEEQRVFVLADIDSPAELWARLGDGYRVEASFILWESPGVLQIPASALFRHAEQWAVFVVAGGEAVRKLISVGQRNGLSAEVSAGLNEGDRVILHPDDRVDDGVTVSAREP